MKKGITVKELKHLLADYPDEKKLSVADCASFAVQLSTTREHREFRDKISRVTESGIRVTEA